MRHKGNRLIVLGLAVMVGPIVIFLIVSSLPKIFSSNTVLFWHYLSAFGLLFYGPIGLFILIFGLMRRFFVSQDTPANDDWKKGIYH
jgi:hypothetical protein